jgi:phenylpyruvate tautomerase PptA (4-oxalocrotonate tautomerase family)
MPIVTVTVRKPKTPEFKAKVLEAVHAALVRAGVNQNDRFHRIFELNDADFQFDPTFPDVRTKRTDDFVLIEILLGVGRSVKVKKTILADLVDQLTTQGFDPENVMVVFQDVAWENWSPAGGRVPHA